MTPDLRKAGDAAALLAAAAMGGLVGQEIGLPMPFLLGGLSAAGALAMAMSALGRKVSFPEPLRRGFIAVIGAMIGATFTPALLAAVPGFWVSLIAIALYVVTAHWIGFQLYHRLAGYDRITAIYAGMPGGFVEAVTMGEAAGADPRLLTLQHFARVVLVVMSVPLLFYWVGGETVGSAAGQQFSVEAWDWVDIGLVALFAAVGMWLGPKFRLPAPHLMGPLLLSAIAHAAGLADTAAPPWLLAFAQLIVGAGLGAMFAGASSQILGRAFLFGAVAVTLTLALGFAFAVGVAQFSPMGVDALFISFAPGGVVEMGLVALSLGISPVAVTAHHLFRIIIAVAVAARLGR
ncbi:MAG: AbrB family transcriptional regulator [Pseudomonadota bacterium]